LVLSKTGCSYIAGDGDDVCFCNEIPDLAFRVPRLSASCHEALLKVFEPQIDAVLDGADIPLEELFSRWNASNTEPPEELWCIPSAEVGPRIDAALAAGEPWALIIEAQKPNAERTNLVPVALTATLVFEGKTVVAIDVTGLIIERIPTYGQPGFINALTEYLLTRGMRVNGVTPFLVDHTASIIGLMNERDIHLCADRLRPSYIQF